MTQKEYLKSILTDKEISAIMCAIKEHRSIFVAGPPAPTGKSSLVEFLRREYNAQAYDISEQDALRIILDKPLDPMIHRVVDHISDSQQNEEVHDAERP
jgi:hypothetical protein